MARRRWLRRVLLGLLGVLGLLVALVLAVLWIPAASQLVVREALTRWDASNPARVEWRAISGSVAGGLRIDELALFDGAGRPLLAVDRLELDLRLRSLVRGTAEVERLGLRGVDVWVDHAWADLGNPEAPPKPPTPGIGPDLPLEIVAAATIADGRVWQGGEVLVGVDNLNLRARGHGREAEAELDAAGLELPSQGLQVDALALAAAWDSPIAALERLELSAPLVEVERLAGHYDVAEAVGAVELDATASLTQLASRFDLPLERFGERARVQLRAEGGPAKLELGLDLGLGSAGELHVPTGGVPTGERRHAGARVDGRLGQRVLGEPGIGPLRFSLLASITERERRPGFVAHLAADVHERSHDQTLELQAEANLASLDPIHGQATLDVDGAGVELRASVERDAAALRGRWQLHADLERPAELAAALLDVSELATLRGRIDARGRCFTAIPGELDSLRCPLTLRLRRASGFGLAIADARLRARVEPLASPLALDASLRADDLVLSSVPLELDRVEFEAQGTLASLRIHAGARGAHEQLELTGALSLDATKQLELAQLRLRSDRGRVPTQVELLAPTRVRVGDGELEIDALALAAAGGRLDVDGRVGFGPGKTSDLELDLDAIELAQIDPLVPGPTLAGELSAAATLRGTLAAPNVGVELHARGLEVADLHPGELDLLARLGPAATTDLDADLARRLGAALDQSDLVATGLRVWLRVNGPLVRRLRLAAAIPLRLGSGPLLRRREPLAVRLDAKDFALTELGGLMPDTPSWWRQRSPDAAAPPGSPKLMPAGFVDVELALAGTPEQPRMSVQLLGRRLALDELALGSVLARLHYGDGRVGAELDFKPPFAQVEVRASLPATVDLSRASLARAVAWTGEVHSLSFDVRALELGRLRTMLGAKLPAVDRALPRLAGLASFELRGFGSLAAPSVTAVLRVGALRYRSAGLGNLRVAASYVPGDAVAELSLVGPLAGRLDAWVHAPLKLSLRGDEDRVRVDLDERTSASIHAHALELSALAPVVGAMPITGKLDGAVELRGTLAAPELDARVSVEQLARGGAALGDLLVRAGFANARARVDADLIREGTHTVALAAELPLRVELEPTLTGSRLAWEHGGHHRVFATGRQIDDALLAAVLGRAAEPPGPATGIGEREVDLSFDIAGGGSVDSFRLDGAVFGRIESEEHPTLNVELKLALDEAKQRLALKLAPEHAPGLTGSVELDAAVARLVAGEQELADVPYSVDLVAAGFELRPLAALLPAAVVDPRGRLRVDVHGRGRIAQPRLRGELALEDAEITVVPLRQRLTDINLALELSDERIDLRTLAITAGRGGVTGDGHAQLGDDRLGAELGLMVREFPLIRPGLPAMVIDTGIAATLDRTRDDTRIAVALTNPEVRVAGTSEATPKPIPSSDDVEFAGRSEEPAGSPPAGDASHLTLRLELRQPLLITGAMIDMSWAGSLELDVEGPAVEVGGQLEARRGRLRLFNNSFDLRRGVVTLPADGSLDPFLDLEAVAELPEAEVTVAIRGRVSRPELKFSSSPSLSDYQILALLVTGSTEVGEGDSSVASKAASLLAAVSSPQLQSRLQRSLGLDRVALGFGEAVDQPILTVGKRITRKLYVETSYHYNAPKDQNTVQAAVEYDLRPRWSIETFFGDAAVGGFGVYWNRSFPAPAWSSDLHVPDLQIKH